MGKPIYGDGKRERAIEGHQAALAQDDDEDDGEDAAWYACLERKIKKGAKRLTKQEMTVARARGDDVLEKSVAVFEKSKVKRETGDDRYMKQVLKSGTMADKVAAMTLMIQESPAHRMRTLESLLQLAKTGKHTSKMALDALKDLFVANLLPDRRLRTLEQQQAALVDLRVDDILAAALFEEKLALKYAEFLEVVGNSYLRHSDAKLRCFALETLAALIMSKPEKEASVLTMLVNKLGDPEKMVAARCVRLLSDLLRKHRAMTAVVAQEVQTFAARANLQPRALYTAMSFLNQVYLSHDLTELANNLCTMYVRLFATKVAAGEIQTKLLSALLTGLNRAVPYCGEGAEGLDLDSLYKIAHDGTFSTRVQALSLVERLTSASDASVALVAQEKAGRARFYRSLYALLHSKDLRATTRPTLLMNLLFKAVANDPNEDRAVACLKRISQASAQMAPPVAAAALYLISKIFERRPTLKKTLLDSSVCTGPPTKDGQSRWRDDLQKREPMAVPASPLWELSIMRAHFHPSVRAFAEGLAEKGAVEYNSDPLVDLSLSNFLDRFAYRNPKKQSANAKGLAHAKKVVENKPLATPDSFLAKSIAEVAPEDAFYYRYFKSTLATRNAALTKKLAAQDDAGSDADDDGGMEGDDFDNDAFDDDDEEEESDDDSEVEGNDAPLHSAFEEPSDDDASEDADFDEGGSEEADFDEGGDGDGEDDDVDVGGEDDDSEDDDEDLGGLLRADKAPVRMPDDAAPKKQKKAATVKRERASPFQDADAFFEQLESKKKPKKRKA